MKNSFLFVVSVALLAGASLTGYSGSNVKYAKFWITDSPSLNLASDGSGPVASNLYIDSHLTGGDPCVGASDNSTGYTPLYPQMKSCAPQTRKVSVYIPYSSIATVPTECSPIFTSGDIRGYKIDSTWRIILSSLFYKNASATPVRFNFYCGTVGYTIDTDTAVPFAALDSNTRQASYNGTATLTTYGGGTIVAQSFYFPFEITVQQVPSR